MSGLVAFLFQIQVVFNQNCVRRTSIFGLQGSDFSSTNRQLRFINRVHLIYCQSLYFVRLSDLCHLEFRNLELNFEIGKYGTYRYHWNAMIDLTFYLTQDFQREEKTLKMKNAHGDQNSSDLKTI